MRERRRQLGRRPGLEEHRVDALELVALGRIEVVADEIVEIGVLAVLAHRRSSPSSSARRRSADRVRVFTVPSGMLRYVGDLALGQAAPVRQLDERALLLRQFLERTVDTPRDPSVLRGLVRPRPRRHHVRRLVHRRLPPPAKAVDDRVARDGVEPRRRLSPRGIEPRRRAPDAREGVLGRILGATAVADPPQRDPEHRARVPAVELLERRLVAGGDLARATLRRFVCRLPRGGCSRLPEGRAS